ncbi:MAG: PhnD/SsuA/transferrin family substrate-binding protein [Ardenticatenaceae bacterium]|nr:PhnD/SsuA/transferrin family substrate-binding protein [Ardenticatenaceae bacterium]
MSRPLHISTCQAINTVACTQRLAPYLSTPERSIKYVDHRSWRERYDDLLAGTLEMAWVCCWPAARFLMEFPDQVELLAVPVMAPDRYANSAHYFSDIFVKVETPFQSLTDLCQTTFAINDPDSHSGARLVRFSLRSAPTPFFRQVITTGDHLSSLMAVQNGSADAAAIDSTIVDWLAVNQPERLRGLRVLTTLGPSPIPPLLIHKSVPDQQRQKIRHQLLNMNRGQGGQAILKTALLHKFAPPAAFDATPLWRMAEEIDQRQETGDKRKKFE